ncbi:hypothetical protein ABZX85_19555 [Streptomyces sp. NPDC004539]|uniref:hypothetical protein n=1 Tax=Streptomyces sp. NPDC004539 TaxID=3154280 RepID=UPI0033A3273E
MPERGTRVRVLGVCAVLPALWAGPSASASAAAEVPDTAVVIDGTSGRASAVRSGEERFDRLWELFEPTYTGTVPVPSAWGEGRYPAVRLTVVWGLTGVGGWPQTSRAPGGDVAMEVVDQLVVAADGTPWVRRDVSPVVEDDDVRWHRVDRGAYERWAGGPEQADSPGDSHEGVARWAVPGGVGVVLGVCGTLLIRRAAGRRGAGPPREEPRQELIEL